VSTQESGKSGVTTTVFDRVVLARRIAALRAQDPRPTWARVAKEIGKPARTCQYLLKQLQDAGDPDGPVDPMAPVEEHIALLTESMSEVAQAVADAPSGSNAKVGALRSLVDFSEQRLDYMRLAGWLPRNLSALPAEREMQRMFREFAAVLREHDASEAMIKAVLDLADRRLHQPIVNARTISVG
jgi:hypothetical protein